MTKAKRSADGASSNIANQTISLENLAGIEYAGVAGSSKDCKDAVLRLIHFGDRITHAKILSAGRDHCLLLTVNVGDLIAIKSGFASGYGGEGPRTFSHVLQALKAHGTEIVEHNVSPELVERLDRSALTTIDLNQLESSRPLHPSRWYDYVSDRECKREQEGTLWAELPLTIPLAILDGRLVDLALSFWDGPDDRLLKGYRRLEDIVRKRTGIQEHNTKLFARAFHPTDGKLRWQEGNEGEHAGKMNLFTGTYGAHRNRRAHQELQTNPKELLAEFLLLNHLYLLEAQAVDVAPRESESRS